MSPEVSVRSRLATRAALTARLAALAPFEGRFPYRSPERIAAVQRRRLRAAIAYAQRHVPYYAETMRRLALGPGDFRTADDLRRLPLIEREQLQSDPEYFASRERPLQSHLRIASGGSTGRPVTVWHSAGMPFEAGLRWERYRVAAMRIMGRRFRFREVLLTLPWGSAEAQRKALEDMKLAPSGIRVRRVVLRLDTPVPETLRVINQFAPDALGGYSSYIEELLAHVRSSVERLQAPRVAFCYSEGLSGSGERLLAEFGIAPIRSYGAVEAPDIGFECERHSGLHLNVDTCPIRLVDGDGRDVPPGERGEVVVSQLTNRATILLNYRLGDLTALLPGRCTCGRNLPLAAFIEGRVREWALTPRGPIHALVVRALLKDDREVRRYQITQLTPELFRLALVVAPETRRTELAERLARRFREHLGSWAQIEVDYVDDLPRTPAGKTPGFIPLDAAAAPRA